MLNRKWRGIEAGLLLAVTVWAACQTEGAARAAVNITSSDAFAFEMALQEMLVHDAAQTAAPEVNAAAQEAVKEAAAREKENEPEGGFHVTMNVSSSCATVTVCTMRMIFRFMRNIFTG